MSQQEPILFRRWPGNEFFIGAHCGGNVMCSRPWMDDPLTVPEQVGKFYGFPKGYFMNPKEKEMFCWDRKGPMIQRGRR